MSIRYKGPTIYIPTKDDYQIDQYTKLLVRCDSNSRYIQDECGHVITQYGNAQVGNMTKIGNKSLMFDGVDDYLTASDNLAGDHNFVFDTGNFTFECWFYKKTTTNTLPIIIRKSGSWTTNNWFLSDVRSGDNPTVFTFWCYNISSSAAILTSTTVVVPNTWYHLAVCRSGTTINLFVNGILESTVTSSVSLDGGTTTSLNIGGTASAANDIVGSLQEVRVSNIARYNSNFTPPIQRFTTDSNTKLLLHLDDGTIYNDIINPIYIIITTNGSPTWNIENSNTTKGNIYLPDTNSYCTISDSADWNLGLDDFTVDWWEYRTDNTTVNPVFSRNYSTSPGYCGLLCGYANSTTTLACYACTTGASTWDILNSITMGSLVINEWNHFALVRNGSTFKTYKNGVYVATATSSAAIGNTSANPGIGIYGNATTNTFIGYIDCLRLTKGKALWLNNFNPPKRRIGC